MVTTFYPPYNLGGCGTYVRTLSRALVAEGHEVEVVHCIDAWRLKDLEETPEETSDEGILVHRLESKFGLLSPLITHLIGRPGIKSGATRAALARPFDVVHFHNISLVGGPGIIAQSRAPVNLYTLHDHWLLCPTHVFWKNTSKPCDRPTCFSCSLASKIPPQLWRYTRLIKRSIAKVDAILAPSEYTARQHHDRGFEAQIHVLPSFSAIQKKPSGTPRQGRPLFVFVGRVTESKGISQLLEEFAELSAYELHIIGEGDLRRKLQRQFASCSNIQFLGPKPQAQLVPIYQNATALILPSLAPENLPLSILEAFACGTPAVVHDAGGAREPIEATGGGLIYRTRAELHAALSRVVYEPGLREKLSRHAHQGFLRLYTMERHIEKYLAVVKSIQVSKGVT